MAAKFGLKSSNGGKVVLTAEETSQEMMMVLPAENGTIATKNDVASLSTGISTNASNIVGLSTSTSALSTGLSTTNGALAVVNAYAQAAVQGVASLSTSVSSTNSGLAALSTSTASSIASLSTTDSILVQGLNSANSGISSLSTGLASTNSGISSLATSTSAGLSTLTSGLSSANSSIASLSTSGAAIPSLSTATSSLSTGLSGASSSITSLSTSTSTSLNGYVPLATSPTAGDLPTLNAQGGIVDSGYAINDALQTNKNLWSAAQIQSAIVQELLNTPSLPPVTVASTANVATLSGAATIDGVALATGNYVLLKNQTNNDNGVWRVVTTGAWVRQSVVNGAYADVTTETTYAQLGINGGVANVLAGNANKNIQYQIYVQNPSAVFGATTVFVTATTKIPAAGITNRYIDAAIGNDTNNNGSVSFPYATLSAALSNGASWPLCITATSNQAFSAAQTWTSGMSNTTVQGNYATQFVQNVNFSGQHTFASGSTRVNFKGLFFSTGSTAPFAFQSGALCRNNFQDLTINTTAADWLGLTTNVSNFITLNNISFSNAGLNAINLPAISNPFGIYCLNQRGYSGALFFTGAGSSNISIYVSGCDEATVRVPGNFLGSINWAGAAFAVPVGSAAYTSGFIGTQADLTTILNWTSDSTYDGYYVVNFAGPTSFAQGAVIGKQTGGGATSTWYARTFIYAPSTLTNVLGVTYAKSGAGYVPVSTSAVASALAQRDANANLSANAFFAGFQAITASGSLVTLTASSPPVTYVSGSGGQTIKLPSALTLPNGAIFSFNNNQSSGAITVQNNSGTTVLTVQSGAYGTLVLTSNSIAAGTWDTHFQVPSNVAWSINTLNYVGSITGATWNGNAISALYGGALAVAAVQTTSFTAASGNLYPINSTSGAVTVTLPASPSVGDRIALVDYANKFATNNVTINPNGLKINSSTSNVVVSTNNANPSLIYIDATQGWSLQVLAAGGGGGGALTSYAITSRPTTTLTPFYNSSLGVAEFYNGTFYQPQNLLVLTAVLTSAPVSGVTAAGTYVMTAGTPPSGVALGDIFWWSGTAATLAYSYANGAEVVQVGAGSSAVLWRKVGGTWLADGYLSALPSAAASDTVSPVVWNTSSKQLQAQATVVTFGTVLDNTLTTPPSSPGVGDAYLVPATGATGAWAALANNVVQWSGSAWVAQAPVANAQVSVAGGANAGAVLIYSATSSAWVAAPNAALVVPQNAVTNPATAVGSLYEDSTNRLAEITLAASTPAPITPVNVLAFLTTTPTGSTPSGLYIQTGGTLPSLTAGSGQIFYNDVYYWNASTLTAWRKYSYAGCPAIITVGVAAANAQAWFKNGLGGWSQVTSSGGGGVSAVTGEYRLFTQNPGSSWLPAGTGPYQVSAYPALAALLAGGSAANTASGNYPSGASTTVLSYGNGRYVRIASNPISTQYSTNGTTWVAGGALPTLPSGSWAHNIVWNGRVFFVVAYVNGQGIGATSPDGVTWTQRNLPTPTGSGYYGVGALGTLLCATQYSATSGGARVAISADDGATWTSTILPFNLADFVAGGGGKLITAQYGGTSGAWSSDGTNWNSFTLPTNAVWDTAVWTGSFWLMGHGSAIATMCMSYDGVNWFNVTNPAGAVACPRLYWNGSYIIQPDSNNNRYLFYKDPRGVISQLSGLSYSTSWVASDGTGATFVRDQSATSSSLVTITPATTFTAGAAPTSVSGPSTWFVCTTNISAGAVNPIVKNAAYTAEANAVYANNTSSGGFTVTLPANPAVGNTVSLLDYSQSFGTNNLTINPNGALIGGVSRNYALSVNGQNITLMYVDATKGWLATNYFTWTNSLTGDALTASALTTSLAAFNAAGANSLVEITATEYTNLQAIAATSIIGASNTTMNGASSGGTNGTNYVTSTNTAIPSGAKIVGFRVVISASTNAEIWQCTNYTAGNLAYKLYATGTLSAGSHYFVLKTPTAISGNQYLAINNNGSLGIAATTASGVTFTGAYASPPANSPVTLGTNYTAQYPMIQLLNRTT